MRVKQRRVVITGAGAVSALGLNPDDLYQALLSGKSAVRLMPEWTGELDGTHTVAAAPIELAPAIVKNIPRHYRRSMGTAAVFAALAAQQAVSASGLTEEILRSGRTGCIASSTVGSASGMYESTKAVLEKRFDDLSSCQFFRVVSHSSAFNVANLFGINGVQLSPCSACASALQSVGAAYEQILLGRQDVILAGGSDEVTPMVAGSFRHLYALSENHEMPAQEQSRPFDSRRAGLVCGEGAGMLVIEEYEHAVRRGAPVLAEIYGYATNCTGTQISQSDAASIETCMNLALEDAGVSASGINYISAHATGTVAGDREEAAAIRNVFGSGVPVSSLKGHLGHTLGASGALEMAAVLEMMKHGKVIPTRNLDEPSEDCQGLDLPRTVQDRDPELVLKNCIAFGGVNSSLVFGKTLK